LDSQQNAIEITKLIEKSIYSLATFPLSHPKAYEANAFVDMNIRQLICKNYRIIYYIKKDIVFVLTILNCRQNLLSSYIFKNIVKK
jgi:plasmid stabilization system protein ParE